MECGSSSVWRLRTDIRVVGFLDVRELDTACACGCFLDHNRARSDR